ncbi:DUF1918 domain-containing protein [Nonomuraea sp. 10N515B]|uniref:DUF1918 domain-containing protein n=1 Tax=Nonomuraea sp. 10N515B TaxID=3457422 RepID=UPI003FCE6DE4
MKATVGWSRRVRGESIRREGFIVEVSHADGSPPYLVHWLDDGHESLIFPGPDAWIVRPVSRTAQA